MAPVSLSVVNEAGIEQPVLYLVPLQSHRVITVPVSPQKDKAVQDATVCHRSFLFFWHGVYSI